MRSWLDDRVDLYLGKEGSYLTVILEYEGANPATNYQYLQKAIEEEPSIFLQSLDRLYQSEPSKEKEVNQFEFLRSLKLVNDLYFNNSIVFELHEYGIKYVKKAQVHFFRDLNASEREISEAIRRKIEGVLRPYKPELYNETNTIEPLTDPAESKLQRIGLRIALGIPVSQSLLDYLDADKLQLFFNKNNYPELERLIQLGIVSFSKLNTLNSSVLAHLFNLNIGKHCEATRNYLRTDEWWELALIQANTYAQLANYRPLLQEVLAIPQVLSIYKNNKILYRLLMTNATAISILAHDYQKENTRNLLGDLLQWDNDFTFKLIQNSAPLVLLIKEKQLTILALLKLYQRDDASKEKYHILIDHLSEIERLIRQKKICFHELENFSSASQLEYYIITSRETNETTSSMQLR